MNSSWSFLLVTVDGGQTWKQASYPRGLAGADMLLVTPSDGWMLGRSSVDGEELFVTHDGTRSWQRITPAAPKEIAPADCFTLNLPTFEDAKRGFLQVNCVSKMNGKLKLHLALLRTEDGGRTWKPERMVANLDDIARTQYLSSTIVGSDWIFAAASEHHPVLTKVGPGAGIDASSNTAVSRPLYKAIRQISFATPADGWAIVGDGDLLSTTDGGATWTKLLPGPQPHVIPPHGTFIPRQSSGQNANQR
jgi:photosystem II stability/assembly factor-like uncharacterized protein